MLSCIQTPAWLTEMIEHTTWRSLVYKLAEEYPDCLMLNFTIKVGLILSNKKEFVNHSAYFCIYS